MGRSEEKVKEVRGWPVKAREKERKIRRHPDQSHTVEIPNDLT